MWKNPRVIGAGILLVISVALDFTSSVMSIVSDGVCIGAALFVLWPLLTDKKQ